jgi:precorrin-6Y C5,15-methyltransferase (decarboxylating)
MANVETLTVHGRPVEQMIAFIQPRQRLLVLTTGDQTPGEIANFLTMRGFGQSKLTVLAAMGGNNEQIFFGHAETWGHEVPSFNTLAVECIAAPDAVLLPRVPGLPDDFFEHDGTMTKREVRALTIAKLMPMRGALLWDIGAGCGSVAVEWMRAARDAQAIGIEPNADRRLMASKNALSLGTPQLQLVDGSAPLALIELPPPDAVFVGGGLTNEVFDSAWAALKPLGRFVANAVTLESEKILMELLEKHGGELSRLAVSRAEPVGKYHGWRSFMSVTQWSIVKR